jgi:hypothetical protein
MNKIKTIKIGLMLLDKIFELKDVDETIKSFGEFDPRYSATLNIKEILASQIGGITEDNYNDVIPNILSLVYDDLLSKEMQNIDSVGIWIEFEDGQIIDNSIKLSVLEDIKRYGAEDINPIYEFYNMTIQKYETTV